ncbi:MAG: outer membrane protein assembly factor BamA [Treponema sp.]|jgi:outer membrane protein insertion porin family|nr:outer membrane protein assembly factor BamA [Treponema sp.]
MRVRVFAFLLLTITVFAFSQEESQEAEDWSWYQGKPIRDIVFSGLRNMTQRELDEIMSPYKGRNFDENIFWEMQGKLYALEYFDRIEPSIHRATSSGNEVIIRFSVVERPVIGRISFVGNSGLRPRELQEVLTSRVNDIYNQAKIRADIQALINKYIEKGYPNVSITSSETQAGDSTINLIFHITENERISISKINFQGNTRFPSNTLRSQLSLKAKSFILSDGAFQETKLIADRETITKYYRDRGYIDAIVRDVTRTYDSNDRGTNLVLTFMIEEGSEFKFGGVTFEGNIIFTTEQLERLVTSKVDEIVNMTKVEMDLQRVADLYYENGYIYNSIIRTPNKDIQTNTLSYTVTIVERSRAYIENIIIIGNSKTKSHVILREIPLEPGDVFSKTKVMEAMRNLYNLQYFSMIMPDTLQGSTENLMDLVFTFEEQMTSDIQFGLTFSGSADPNAFPISGLIKWNDRNVAGSGNELGAEINSSVIDSLTVSLNYLHRWAFGLPLSLGADFSTNYSKRYATMNNHAPFFNGDEDYAYPDGFNSREEYANNRYLPPRDYLMSYDQLYISLGLSTGYRWSTFFGIFGISGGGRAGIIRNTYNDELYRPFDPALRAGNNTWMPKNSLWLSFSLDQRDIFYDPSRGYYLFNRTGLYGILENEREHYIKNDSKAEYFLTLFDVPVTDSWNFKSVLGLHVGLSVLFGQPGRGTPTIEDANKLAVDGMFVGRGWNTEYRNKGLLLLDSWVELRFPVVRGILSFDLFFDAAGVEKTQGYYFGQNHEGDDNFTIENMRFSFGGGFRFTMPQFPIRLSLLKRFTIVNGNIKWEPGAIFGDPNNPAMGLDLVMSFVLSY